MRIHYLFTGRPLGSRRLVLLCTEVLMAATPCLLLLRALH
jgi:hypothetical protein